MFGEGDSGLQLKKSSTSNIFDSLQNSVEDDTYSDEYAKDFDLNTSEIEYQEPNKQCDNSKKTMHLNLGQIANISLPEKKIEKIMIFYSDNTFEVFER